MPNSGEIHRPGGPPRVGMEVTGTVDLEPVEGEGATIMPTCWDEPLATLTARAEDWAGVWSIAYTVGLGLQRLASVDGSDEDLTLTYAGLDVALAVSELEWADPTGTAQAIDIDLGPGSTAHDVAVRRLCYLINDALVLIGTLTSGGRSTARQAQAGTRAWALLFRAQETLAGRGS